MTSTRHFKLGAMDNTNSEVINFRHSAAHQMGLGRLIKPIQMVRKETVLQIELSLSLPLYLL